LCQFGLVTVRDRQTDGQTDARCN